MSAPTPTPTPTTLPTFAITRTENFTKWFSLASSSMRPSVIGGRLSLQVRLHALLPTKQSPQGYEFVLRFEPTSNDPSESHIAVVHHLYDKCIGYTGCLWAEEGTPIAYRHAKVRFGDLFEFYTSPDGVLKLPEWCSMRFAVDQFLEEDPRIKFHPSRVRQFINENGIDELETME